jgi:NAD(P)H dehydrogenase (quinone)
MRVLTVIAHPNPKSFCHAVLAQFTSGLKDAGHSCEVVDLYAIHFDPVFRLQDYASYVHESMPADVLERMNLRQYVLDAMPGRIARFVASRWMGSKDPATLAKIIHQRRPKDVVAQWEKVQRAEGLAFIAPVFWLHFPAILKGWFERVFSYGDAYALTDDGWRGHVRGRVPLLHHEKAVVITPTHFGEEDYRRALEPPMTTVIDNWGLKYPGVKTVEHVYFYQVGFTDDETRRGYLERAYRLGREFAQSTN